MATEIALTTVDNPFNPFTHFEEWYVFDTQKGYNTCSYLARIVETNPLMSEIETAQEERRGMLEIAEININGLYRVVTPENYDSDGNFVYIDRDIPTIE